MTQAILKRIRDGQLPMHFLRTDVGELKQLRDAGYLKLDINALPNESRTAATVTGVTPLGYAAIRYFGFAVRAQHLRTRR